MGPLSPATASPIRLLWPRARGFANRWIKADRATRLGYLLFGGLGLIVWVSLFVGLVLAVDAFWQVEVFGPLITRKLLELLLLSLFGMLLFSNVVTALSSFYLSEDLELLLSLPIRRHTFFYTRWLDTAAQSSWMMALFGVPVFLSFGMAARAPAHYYALLLVVVPSLLVFPVNVGAVVASVLVSAFPARRTKEVLAVVGILFLVSLFILLRVLRPERLVDAQDFQSLASYIAEMQTPVPALFPPRWAVTVLDAAMQDRPMPWLELGLLVSGAVGTTGLARWITDALFDEGWTRSQEAPAARMAKAGAFDATLRLVTRPFPAPIAAVLVKDIKIFVRDPAQWSQVFLLISLVVIYLFSVRSLPTDFIRGPYLQGFKNALAFLNLGMTGFVMSAIAVRFQFASISGEGRSFWLLRVAPIRPEAYLWAKALPGLLPMLVVGEVLVVASTSILGAPPALVTIGAFTALGFALGLSGIAVGMGALYPDFKADNVARAASGPAAIIYMVAALAFIAAVVALLGVPVWILLKAQFEERGLTGSEMSISAVLYGAVALVCAVATVLPVRRAAVGLWSRGL